MYSTFFLFFLSAFCAKANINPTDSTPAQHPYMVTFFDSKERTTRMFHGVLISLDWILTTRTIVEVIINSTEYFLDLVEAGTGTKPTDINSTMDTKDTWREIDTYLKLQDKFHKGDIGLVKVHKPYVQSATIKPITIPKTPFTGNFRCDKAKVVGFGLDVKEKKDAVKLQELQVEVLNLTQCSRIAPLLPDLTTICVNAEFCGQNHGQALVCENGQEHVLLGLLMNNTECQKPYPVTNLTAYMTWIHNISKVGISFWSAPKQGDDPSVIERDVKLILSGEASSGTSRVKANFAMVLIAASVVIRKICGV